MTFREVEKTLGSEKRCYSAHSPVKVFRMTILLSY
jgi:hypothetical protein